MKKSVQNVKCYWKALQNVTVRLSLAFLVFAGASSCGGNFDCDKGDCLNGGVCADGTCHCPEGFVGINCGSEETPHKMEIIEVKVLRLPEVNESSPWDKDGSGPDLVVGTTSSGTPYYRLDNKKENADPSVKHVFDFTAEPFNVHPTEPVSLIIGDVDERIVEFIGGITFEPYERGLGFKERMIADAEGNVAFEIKLKYYW